jgi:hypothetical protein
MEASIFENEFQIKGPSEASQILLCDVNLFRIKELAPKRE